MSVKRSVIRSDALPATAMLESPSARESEIALNPFTSDSMALEMAQTAELSFAEPTSLPVEIIDCVLERSLLIDFRVWSATIALLLVRILDILLPS